MNPNYNFTGEEFNDENWRELPDELPPFTTESVAATGADFEFDLTYRSIRGEQLQENYFSSGEFISAKTQVPLGDRDPLSQEFDHKTRTTSAEIQISSQQKYQHSPPLDLKAPAVPFYLGFSHFSLKLSLSELVPRVENCLNQIIELDYSFLENLCKVSSLAYL
jgi:hypothetical protein